MFARHVAILVRFPTRSRLARALTVQTHATPLSRTALAFYATGGRPRKAVGEPSRPVNRSVKRTSSTPAVGKKVKANKKKSVKKPASKTPKVLTEKQKEARKKRKEKAKIVEFKKAALDPPQIKKISAFNLFTVDKRKEFPSSSGQSEVERRELFVQTSRDIGRQWRNLPTAEVEHYNHLANTTRRETEAAYKQWVQSHTVKEIQEANSARKYLRRVFPSGHRRQSKWPAIQDEREVKRPVSGFLRFSIDRNHSGDFRNIPVTERGKRIAQEWRELSDTDKQKYQSLQAEDANRYASEYSSVYGQSHQTASAAA